MAAPARASQNGCCGSCYGTVREFVREFPKTARFAAVTETVTVIFAGLSSCFSWAPFVAGPCCGVCCIGTCCCVWGETQKKEAKADRAGRQALTLHRSASMPVKLPRGTSSQLSMPRSSSVISIQSEPAGLARSPSSASTRSVIEYRNAAGQPVKIDLSHLDLGQPATRSSENP